MSNESNDFTYHKVSEKEREQIKKDSKRLLDEFSSKLERIKTKEGHFSSSVSESGLRDEAKGWETDADFRDVTFCNAPITDDDSIVAEKGGWK